MGKVQQPMYQFDPEGGGEHSQKGDGGGARDHTNIKGVPFMPAKGLYYPGADEPQTSGAYYSQRFVSIPNPPDFTEYLVKDIQRIPETFVVDTEARPLQVVTTVVNLPELSNLLQIEYKLEFTVFKRRQGAIAALRSLASSLLES